MADSGIDPGSGESVLRPTLSRPQPAPFTLDVMRAAVALVAALMLAIVALRRIRGVLAVGSRAVARPQPAERRRGRYDRFASSFIVAVRIAFGLGAVLLIAALARRLFH
jgi:hypothetical protein